jgi:hypothetical protein
MIMFLLLIKFVAFMAYVNNITVWVLFLKCVAERQERGYVAA